jgi:hypothetical protein
MSLKHRYSRSRPPGEGQKGATDKYATGTPPSRRMGGEEERCTCWVLMRGEGSPPLDRQTADCELVPDPSCPVHGKKRYPILDGGDWGG